MNYRDLKMYGLHACATCGAVVREEDQGLHDDWHAVIENQEQRLEDLLIAVVD
jgi:hypothetical protein